ncbi:phage holin family protein [Emticicia sp. BO119]|uniref:phage holin family protein n=1 Tax=Emticicia sp. BO119 TaxID=2757768 RepID=UPI0015F10975|nr:phage holin family protein [Emticicia sp. BO119]MBA4851363.1 phage holin family protein [Emticicia sp. BO119]
MKNTLLALKDQITNHPYMISFLALLSTLLKFILQSWQVDGILFIFLFVMIGIDTWTGIRVARKQKNYDYKVLKEKFVKKVLGYIIFLIALWTFTMMLFLMNIKDGETVINSYYLNVPMMTTILFFAGIEFLSVKDNITHIFGIRTPSSVVGKVESFVGNGGKDFGNLTDQKKDE